MVSSVWMLSATPYIGLVISVGLKPEDLDLIQSVTKPIGFAKAIWSGNKSCLVSYQIAVLSKRLRKNQICCDEPFQP